MLKKLTIATTLLGLMMTPGLVPAASAGGLSLHFGGGFHIGGVLFKIGVHHRNHRYHDHYYRTRHNVRYEGYSCNRACYRESGYTHHHRSCPVVRHHFDRYRYSSQAVYDAYAPRYERPRYGNNDRRYRNDDYRYNSRDRYDRSPRDRYDRGRRDRYDRREKCDRRN